MEQTAHVTMDPRSSKVIGWDKIFAIIEAEDKEKREIEAKMEHIVTGYFEGRMSGKTPTDNESVVSLESPQDVDVDGGLAQYKDYEVHIRDERNFVLRHRTDESKIIEISMKPNSSHQGGWEWVNLPKCLEMQLSVFNEQELAEYPGTLLKVILSQLY